MVTARMPWELVRLPFRDTTRAYKKYPNGVTLAASDEETRVWEYVESLKGELAAAKALVAPVVPVAPPDASPPKPARTR